MAKKGLDDTEFKIRDIVYGKIIDAIKAEYQRNGGNKLSALQTVQGSFDFKGAKQAAEEEYYAKHKRT